MKIAGEVSLSDENGQTNKHLYRGDYITSLAEVATFTARQQHDTRQNNTDNTYEQDTVHSSYTILLFFNLLLFPAGF